MTNSLLHKAALFAAILFLFGGCTAAPTPQPSSEGGAVSATLNDDSPDWLKRWYEYITPGAEHEQLAYFSGTWHGESTVPVSSQCSPGAKASMMLTCTPELNGLFLIMRTSYESRSCESQGFGAKGFNKSTGEFEWFYAKSTGSGMSFFKGSYDAAARSFQFKADVPGEYGPVPSRIVERVIDQDTFEFDLYQDYEGEELHKVHVVFRRAK